MRDVTVVLKYEIPAIDKLFFFVTIGIGIAYGIGGCFY